MRRLLSGACALSILAISAVAGSAASAQEAEPSDVTPTISRTIVVNEVATRGEQGELDEFIELANVSNVERDLSNYQVRIYDTQNREIDRITIPAGVVLAPRGTVTGSFLVLTGPEFSGTVEDPTNVLPFELREPNPQNPVSIPDVGGVALFNPRNVKIDGLAWSRGASTPLEGTPALAMSQQLEELGLAVSAARDILSTDTDNNRVDFALHRATPGAPN